MASVQTKTLTVYKFVRTLFLLFGQLFPWPMRDVVTGGEGPLVVCEPAGALHGPAGQDRLRTELLR